jgi:hypothetical protein
MPAFVVSVNGRQVCSADLDSGAHGVHITWLGPATKPMLIFHVGGVVNDEHVRWDMPELTVGDEITIKIAASAGTTPPDQREPHEPIDRSGKYPA